MNTQIFNLKKYDLKGHTLLSQIMCISRSLFPSLSLTLSLYQALYLPLLLHANINLTLTYVLMDNFLSLFLIHFENAILELCFFPTKYATHYAYCIVLLFTNLFDLTKPQGHSLNTKIYLDTYIMPWLLLTL